MGAVLHTLNIRLFPEQLVYVVNHAEDQVVIVDDSLIPLLGQRCRELTTVEHVIVVGDGDLRRCDGARRTTVLRYDDLLAAERRAFDWPEIDERHAAADVLHERHDRQPEGRRLLAPLDRSCTRSRSCTSNALAAVRRATAC